MQGENTTTESRAECRRLIDSRKEGFVSLLNYTKQGKEFHNALYMRPLYCNGECLFFLGTQCNLDRVGDATGQYEAMRQCNLRWESRRSQEIASRGKQMADGRHIPGLGESSTKTDGPSPASRLPDHNSFSWFCQQNELEVATGLAQLVEGCPICVTSSGPGEPIVWLNNEFLVLSGYERGEIIGFGSKLWKPVFR